MLYYLFKIMKIKTMTNAYISKEGMAVICLAKYLMTTRPDDRLRTIDSLSEEIGVSVGFIQKAFTTLENDKAVSLSKQGRNGTYIRQLDYQKLVRYSGISHVVCAMPLPYTKHYEGLASGLKAQLGSLPLYFAHMRGADVRAECLKKGVYDLAIMSKLAAGTLGSSVKILADLGAESYSLEHRLIYRENEYETIKRVGVDPASPDQRILTEKAFAEKEIEIVEINYSNSLSYLVSGQIDAVVWLPEAIDMNVSGLCEKSLQHIDECRQASQAVILVGRQSQHVSELISKLLDVHQLLVHQRLVIEGKLIPSY